MKRGCCTVTAISREYENQNNEKHGIKRADRLLSNAALQAETPLICGAMTRLLCQGKHPLILVDWSDADKAKRHHILRASLALEGRPLTLHQMVVPMDEYTPAHHCCHFCCWLTADRLTCHPMAIYLPSGIPVLPTELK
ncbi:hypothetical protein [Rheinheimera gaetbuli]